MDDLIFELTRAANWIIKLFRKRINPNFRSEEGVLLITTGPHMDLSYHWHRLEYSDEDLSHQPFYTGIKIFKDETRFKRDEFFGKL